VELLCILNGNSGPVSGPSIPHVFFMRVWFLLCGSNRVARMKRSAIRGIYAGSPDSGLSGLYPGYTINRFVRD